MTTETLANGVRVFGGYWGRDRGGPTRGHLINAALYPPGAVCLAMDGCPVNPNCWTVVTWYPGVETLMRCFASEAAAGAFLADAIH